MRRNKISKDDIDAMQLEYDKGSSVKHIMYVFGLCEWTVRKYIRTTGRRVNKVSDDEICECYSRVGAGSAVAEILGIGKNRTYRVLKERGLLRKNTLNEEDVIRAFRELRSLPSVASALHTSVRRVRRILDAHGVERPKRKTYDRSKMIELKEELGTNKAAQALGCARSTIWRAEQ